ncbi:MAG TPA: 16S rRNA (cytosine(967)-C(5))-methyltransferase RsmB [Candidatus Polarisedimenticolia bacterium]|nr:16S rRNA (cytosine(967)-C(5))-methyltransferase RsmB [Candidatus Polarisedimenticolia bacterium]
MPRHPPAEPKARTAAFEILQAIDAGRGHSNALLAALPEEMNERDRALATELVYGVLRRRRALDRQIEQVSRRPLTTIDAPVLTLLRLALYQVLFLSRVPRSAAVNESVALARSSRGVAAASFTNGVLRAACRALEEPGTRARTFPDPGESRAAFLAETHSFPEFLVRRFLTRYGDEECAALLEAMNRPAPGALRPTRLAGSPEALAGRLLAQGVQTAPSPYLRGALRVLHGVPQRTDLFRQGTFYIQDEASQLVARLLLPIGSGETLVDLCAAPGGKILAAADECARGAGPLLAADLEIDRLRTLRENAARTGVEGIACVVMDATRPALRPGFNRILLDAPCSGTGIIRRHPEIRWRRSEKEIAAFARRQARALEQAADLLAPGGRLVYAVCSLEPEEGRERIEALLLTRSDLQPRDARRFLPQEAWGMVDRDGFFTTLPHRDDLDGFFAAVLEKR